MPIKGALLGHSFVTSLHSQLSLPPGYVQATPQHVAQQLRISHHVSHLHLLGHRGATATDFPLPSILQQLNHKKPRFVIIELGTNDLATGTCPLQVASAVVDIANAILQVRYVHHVVINSILPRSNNLSIPPHHFLANLHRCNLYLSHFCDVEPKLTYHAHRGFSSIPFQTWSRDGIHPTATTGLRLYKTSLRRAIFSVLQHFRDLI